MKSNTAESASTENGQAPNRRTHHQAGHFHEQGLSPRRFAPEELFAKETLETYKV